MTRAEIEKKVFGIIAKYCDVPVDELNLDNVMDRDLGMDSLDKGEAALEIEGACGVTFQDEDQETMKTIGDAVEHVERQLKTD